MVGDAAVQIGMEVLNENVSYTLALAPLDDTELTAEEKAAGEGVKRQGRFYAMKLTGPEADMEKAKNGGISAYYSVGTEAQQPSILFFEEDRTNPDSILMIAENASAIARENETTYVTAPAAVSGIFTAV